MVQMLCVSSVSGTVISLTLTLTGEHRPSHLLPENGTEMGELVKITFALSFSVSCGGV